MKLADRRWRMADQSSIIGGQDPINMPELPTLLFVEALNERILNRFRRSASAARLLSALSIRRSAPRKERKF
jgi:hypothetical protein